MSLFMILMKFLLGFWYGLPSERITSGHGEAPVGRESIHGYRDRGYENEIPSTGRHEIADHGWRRNEGGSKRHGNAACSRRERDDARLRAARSG